ncbi:hypothetical protein Tco_0884663, partial [Tanacetum coccineum]
IKKMNKKGVDSSKSEVIKEESKEEVQKESKEEEGTKKRKRGHIKMIARKKARKQSDVESEDEHKKCLKIVTFESIFDSEIMEKKSFIARLNKVSSPDGDYLVIYKANVNFRAFNYLMEILHIFDRQDLFHLLEEINDAEEEATNDALIRNYDDIKARIEADRLLAEKFQEEEREQFTIEERIKFLHDLIATQRKFLAQQRSKAIKNRPPTKNQLKNQMMAYLKHVGNFKHSDLKTKKFEEIHALYEKIKRSDEDFISIGSAEDERLIKEMNEKGIDSSKNESVKEEGKENEGTKKRKGGHIKMTARKKKRSQSDVDSDDEHKKCLKIVTFESILDSEIMEKKSVIAILNKVSSPDGDYLVIYSANGNFRAFNYLMEEFGGFRDSYYYDVERKISSSQRFIARWKNDAVEWNWKKVFNSHLASIGEELASPRSNKFW